MRVPGEAIKTVKDADPRQPPGIGEPMETYAHLGLVSSSVQTIFTREARVPSSGTGTFT